MIETPQPHTLLKSTQTALELLTKLLALAATVCIALSVIFDWGYLSALDLKFSEVPTSLSDHTRSAILWLPVVGYMFPLAIVFTLFMSQLEARDFLKAMNRGENPLKHAANEERHSPRNLAILAVICFAIWLAFGERSGHFLVFTAFILWTLVVVQVTPVIEGNWRLIYLIRLCLVLPIFCAGSLYSFGYYTGRAAIAPDQPLGTLIFRGSAGQGQMKGNIVRPFERFVIVLDENRKIILLKPDDIVRVERVGQVSSNKGLLCEYWQLACPHIPTHTP